MNKKIILNHKSYLNYDEILKYKSELENFKCDYEIILFPTIIYLPLFKESKYKIGTQNFYSDNYGSYTGEISLESLKCIGVNYTLIGHSERIKYNLDSKNIIKYKLDKSLTSTFNTILCVGEMKRRVNSVSHVKKQLNFYLKDINDSFIKNLSIAYEPAWAIGGTASMEIPEISKVIKYIKEYVLKKYKYNIEVYYGGSVNENSIDDIMKISDGVLIGKMSADILKIKDVIDKIC